MSESLMDEALETSGEGILFLLEEFSELPRDKSLRIGSSNK